MDDDYRQSFAPGDWSKPDEPEVIKTELDVLAIAVVRDMSAWRALCDHCEERGHIYHPLAIVQMLTMRHEIGFNFYDFRERATELAFGVSKDSRTPAAWASLDPARQEAEWQVRRLSRWAYQIDQDARQ